MKTRKFLLCFTGVSIVAINAFAFANLTIGGPASVGEAVPTEVSTSLRGGLGCCYTVSTDFCDVGGQCCSGGHYTKVWDNGDDKGEPYGIATCGKAGTTCLPKHKNYAYCVK